MREAVGPPEDALPVPVAPTAPEPFVPEVSTPVKLITVIEAATDWERVAVTVTALKALGAKARQISASPLCTFVRAIGTQVRFPPAIFVTVVFAPER